MEIVIVGVESFYKEKCVLFRCMTMFLVWWKQTVLNRNNITKSGVVTIVVVIPTYLKHNQFITYNMGRHVKLKQKYVQRYFWNMHVKFILFCKILIVTLTLYSL